jgi:arsenite methyltransferase
MRCNGGVCDGWRRRERLRPRRDDGVNTDAAFWNKLAPSYARQPVENPEAFERKIEITKSRMRPEHVVLDVGCGTGSLALRLAPSASHVHGLDLSSEMIRIAGDKARAQGVSNVSFHVGPFDDTFTLFPEESLDGICVYSLLHLVDDRPAVLRRVHRLLKPGGFFISSTTVLGESSFPYGGVLTLMRWLGKAPRLVSVITKRTLEDVIRDAGFVAISHPDVGAKSTIAFVVASKPG